MALTPGTLKPPTPRTASQILAPAQPRADGGFNPDSAAGQAPDPYAPIMDWWKSTGGAGAGSAIAPPPGTNLTGVDQVPKPPANATWKDNYAGAAGFGAAPAPGAGMGGSADDIINKTRAGLPPTSESIDKILAALKAAGFNASRATRAGGSGWSDDKIILPDGRMIDLITDVGGPGAAWSFQVVDNSPSANAGTSGNFSMPPLQTYTGGMPTAAGQLAAGIAGGNSAPSNVNTNNAMNQLAQQLMQKLADTSRPDTAALKEAQKETLNSLREQSGENLATSAARRGLSGGWEAGQLAGLDDAFNSQLTTSYRDIDQRAQQQEFANLLASEGAASNLGNTLFNQELGNANFGLQGELGRGGLDVQRQSLANQFTLGQGSLAQQLASLQLQRELGMGGLGLQQASLEQNGMMDFYKLLLGLG